MPAPPREPLSPGQWRAGGAGNERSPGTFGGVRGLPEIPRRNHVAGQAAGRLGSKLRARHTNPGCPNPLGERVQAAANTKSIRRPEPQNVFFNCWLELIWPCRRIWTGLAAVWIALFIFNFSQRDPSELMARKSPPPSPEMILAFRQQERLLAELIGPNETRAAEPPKPFLPQPRSEGRIEILTT